MSLQSNLGNSAPHGLCSWNAVHSGTLLQQERHKPPKLVHKVRLQKNLWLALKEHLGKLYQEAPVITSRFCFRTTACLWSHSEDSIGLKEVLGLTEETQSSVVLNWFIFKSQIIKIRSHHKWSRGRHITVIYRSSARIFKMLTNRKGNQTWKQKDFTPFKPFRNYFILFQSSERLYRL